jgi:cell division septation protein DedD
MNAQGLKSGGDTMTENSTQYYSYSFGVELGPMLFADVVKMIEDGALEASDTVRSTKSSVWAAVETFAELKDYLPTVGQPESTESVASPAVAAEPASSPKTDAAKPARTASVTSNRRRSQDDEGETVDSAGMDTDTELPVVRAAAPRPPAVSPPSQTPVTATTAPPTRDSRPTPAPVSRPAAPAFALQPKRSGIDVGEILGNRKVQIGAGIIVALALLFVFLPRGTASSHRVWCDLLMNLEKRHLQMQSSEADEAQWQSFDKQANEDVAEMVDALKDTASAAEPVTQHLLWASRDYLPTMIEKCQLETGKPQLNFKYHVKCADRLLRGLSVEPQAIAKSEQEPDQSDAQPVGVTSTSRAPTSSAVGRSSPTNARPTANTGRGAYGPGTGFVPLDNGDTLDEPEPYPEGTKSGDTE